MNSRNAAYIFTTLICFAVVFQIALAVGAPWGHLAWGGAYPGVLPAKIRLASVGSALLLSCMAIVVLARAGICFQKIQKLSQKLIWVVVVYSAIGILANAATPSVPETNLWVPVTALLFVSSLIVAKSRRSE